MPNSVRLRNSCGAQGSQSKGGGTLVLGSLAKDPTALAGGRESLWSPPYPPRNTLTTVSITKPALQD